MIKTIKVENSFRLDELIRKVWDEENFSQYFSQYIALDSDGDLVEIDSRDAVVVSVVDFAYIKFNKTDEYEAKAKAWDKYKAHMESHIAGEINEEEFVSDLKSDYFESGESNVKK